MSSGVRLELESVCVHVEKESALGALECTWLMRAHEAVTRERERE